MDLQTLFRIQIITLCDSICFGLIYGFINPYLLIVGGNHLKVGLFTILNLVCQLLAPDFMKPFTNNSGKQFTLFTVSVAATISYLLITLTNSWWFISISRCIFTITNITNSLCRDILLQKIPKDETEYFLGVHNVLSSCGFIIGPLITGCLFSYGFSYSCWLAAGLTIVNVWLSTNLKITEEDGNEKTENEKPLVEKKKEEVAEVLRYFGESNLQENWDLVILKFLFTSSISIFFSKFTQILQHNFSADAITIGITSSYMNGLIFAGPYLIENVIDKSLSKKMDLIQYSLCVLLLSVLLACYAPFYSFYLFMCIPLTLARCYFNTIWIKLFGSRKNEALERINASLGIISGLIIPVLFGITCDQIGHHAVILYSVIPLVFSLLVYYKRTVIFASNDEREDTNLKNKNE